MTDIVEKLRRRVDHRIDMEASHTKTLEWQAADEIESLRAALRDIAAGQVIELPFIQAIARAALEGNKE